MKDCVLIQDYMKQSLARFPQNNSWLIKERIYPKTTLKSVDPAGSHRDCYARTHQRELVQIARTPLFVGLRTPATMSES